MYNNMKTTGMEGGMVTSKYETLLYHMTTSQAKSLGILSSIYFSS